MGSCSTGNVVPNVDLKEELQDNISLSNARIMAVKDEGFLSTVGINIEAGKRQDLFWIAVAVIVAGVLVSISIFGKRRRRKRR